MVPLPNADIQAVASLACLSGVALRVFAVVVAFWVGVTRVCTDEH